MHYRVQITNDWTAPMKHKLIVAAAIALMAASPAIAREATWSQSAQWTVTGFTDVPMCIATTRYPSENIAISIGLSRAGWSLSLGGVETRVGKQHSVAMQTTNGSYGTLIGIGISNNVVSFENLELRTVGYLATSRGITIQGLGSFALKGSAAAIKETSDCFDALSGQLS